MARWKLMSSHYLKVPDEEWEYKEIDQSTGKERRIRVPVPRLLDPRDPSCWTSRWGFKDNQEGEIIVCYAGKGEPSDQIFLGDPSPDMTPLDDEAKTISASFAHTWSYKPETDTQSFSQSLIDKFQIDIAERQKAPPEIPGLADLTKAMTAMVEQNAKLIETLASPRRI